MALTELAIALDWNIADGSLTPFSDYFGYEPNCSRVPRGSNGTRALNGRLSIDGSQRVTLNIPGVKQSSVNDYVNAIFTNWRTANGVEVTIAWLDQNNEYRKYNAFADMPEVEEDYAFRWSDQLESVRIGFYIIEDITVSE